MNTGNEPIKADKAVTEHKEASLTTYLVIWASLLVLTVITITTANLNMGRLGIIIVLAIASFKSTLVLLYFMHLRYEKQTLIKILIPISMALLAIFIGLTFTDVVAR